MLRCKCSALGLFVMFFVLPPSLSGQGKPQEDSPRLKKVTANGVELHYL